MGIFDKAKEFAEQNADKVSQGVDAAGDFIDEKTGGKFSSQIDQGQQFVKDRFGGGPDQADQVSQQESQVPGEPGQPEAPAFGQQDQGDEFAVDERATQYDPQQPA